jgi:HSP20 family protein
MTPFEWPDEAFFRPLFRAFRGEPEAEVSASYPVDMTESDGKVVVDAEMPGFQRDEINVDINAGRLRIAAERQESEGEEEGTPHLRERRYSRIERSFTLPSEVDPSKASAKLQDGVLHIEMPKLETGGSSRVEIT